MRRSCEVRSNTYNEFKVQFSCRERAVTCLIRTPDYIIIIIILYFNDKTVKFVTKYLQNLPQNIEMIKCFLFKLIIIIKLNLFVKILTIIFPQNNYLNKDDGVEVRLLGRDEVRAVSVSLPPQPAFPPSVCTEPEDGINDLWRNI